MPEPKLYAFSTVIGPACARQMRTYADLAEKLGMGVHEFNAGVQGGSATQQSPGQRAGPGIASCYRLLALPAVRRIASRASQGRVRADQRANRAAALTLTTIRLVPSNDKLLGLRPCGSWRLECQLDGKYETQRRRILI
jgi:hypothetical protein